MEESLFLPVRYLKGVGPKRASAFEKIGVNTVEDLLYYFPKRYEDRRDPIFISGLKTDKAYTVKAEVLSFAQRRSFQRRGFQVTEITVRDSTGKLCCVWFNQPYLKEYFKAGTNLILHGKPEEYAGRLQMNSPEFEIVSDEDEPLNIGRLVPVYSCPNGMTQRYLRRIIKKAQDGYLSKIDDFLPFDIRSRENLFNRAKSLINIHFPASQQDQEEAYRRLSFEEFFIFELPLALRKLRRREKAGIAHNVERELADNFIEKLPFELTRGQQKVIAEIRADMAKPAAMQRLLQGDVGSGKTVVAVAACLTAVQGGYQAAFMVPTEVLARQHYEKIRSQLSGAGCQGGEIKIGLLTGSAKDKERKKIIKEIEAGRTQIVIGTHALLEESVKFKKLGLIVIDEQHKFGVGQRSLLPEKGSNPDVLIMTATPIPRTLAITLYGDLDVSVINELPPGRIPVKTVHFSKEGKRRAYELARNQILAGSQAYIVYPVIEESYALDIEGAKKMYEELRSGEFRDFRLALIHGRMKQAEQDEIMRDFKKGELDLLVSTTVLEVGIDVPNATCMIVEDAERFGLSQLHQLRGRVGRSSKESFCLLISNASSARSRARFEAMIKYNDGFCIAEEDLKIRGPGEFFGQRQSGLSELRIADPLRQMRLLKRAREAALKLVIKDPGLQQRANRPLKEQLLRRFPAYEKLIMTG
ncbi:MAG: ATP-dependent DNA helicase RecG [Candidatus Omnitrophica bacterium]|nr:ATP-dependent DNA helicase RecG [Candidatus Omnitrophota bacterium]MDD5553421.1 ATP-dependent DNA helicase RecG [Candidatus Omnitrophota bacterium]